jgi:hypothetical protein
MRSCLFFFSILIECGVVCQTQGLTLAENSQTDYTIVLEENAPVPERTAADELKKYLTVVTGAHFSIQTGSNLSGRKIFVGDSEVVRKMVPNVHWDHLPNDAIVIKTIDDDLILAGGGTRGTLYAVYTFLEDYIGVRWVTSTAMVL